MFNHYVFKFGRMKTVRNLILKSILQGNNDKEHYCNLNTLQLNISFKNYYQRTIRI